MRVNKLNLILPSLIILASITTASSAAELKVEFTETNKFSDYELTGHTRKKSLSILKKDIQELFKELSDELIDETHHLHINVKNIDLPGNIRYGMGQTSKDIRVIDRDTMFKLSFDYILKDASGAIVNQGEHQLKEFTDAQHSTIPRRNKGTLAYFEKPLKEWMKSTLVK